ncbi:NADPH-dependent assimilatory sulfite reductase hemoprotein subunit [Staphylococcus gallinarum]|jgi:sulfite reductase (NADPH) hemoprotein beta-component|uniref:Sulfite reductase [NADPH] hemoprotein beta-component n=1 Tax=Staphylococcus gallinarum TaxID=1293 RepID=A0A0D0QZX9_STAGA|nr:NADPH-dependent assimilatory sulfite reductase hemoprotein subunit [Staphylococcus gallinarum]KIR12681.1 sulfite reductase [Staphylococcus gallinarum]MCD8785765.1 NADPH-dependent assimilatory sulfite reductase hemoprotein subunit [Staphylococcus gallinarum]MCD8820718.1 NADPH-dependent assimilatory sulfite reductase hemoprotein subunit [Staphylococcus gallinarum]MCD8826363.1 NADPH-dependent assimilatory sulfite reductase hemoprotein subunit [Staphylococcus gallinarum]MCD8829068.1 NADPH-depen
MADSNLNFSEKLDEMERIKTESNYLRGTIEEGLADRITGAIAEEDTKLLKFHGSYMQDDRDLRDERRKQKLEPAYSFMIRVRAPGGASTPEQWIAMDDIANEYANHTIKLTTRQAFQFHGILKRNLKQTMFDINQSLLDTLAACGDVNRNVMSNPNPYQSDVHAEVNQIASDISAHLSPRTQAYHEIWLDGEKVMDTSVEEEPLYGKTYLPRKFKIGIAVPPSNDIDVYSQDIGLISIIEDGKLVGFNVTVGGGMGMTHGNTKTYPQLGRLIGYFPKEHALDVCEKILTIQRDYGNRQERKNARFKYTVDRYGADWVLSELNNRLGWSLESPREFHFDHNGDRYGWTEGSGKWHFTLFIQNGRVKDTEDYKLKTALRKIAEIHTGDFRLTPNQNLVIANVDAQKKPEIEALIDEYGLTDGKHYTGLRRNSMACVAFPTCGLAMAESERYLPSLITKIEDLLDEAGLSEEEITIRMTGCPNGCARPALAEIAFIGKAPGKYNMYLGASFTGDRLNKMYKENIGEAEILESLRPILLQYAKERTEGEHFGDFVVRAGIVDAVNDGQVFHS